MNRIQLNVSRQVLPFLLLLLGVTLLGALSPGQVAAASPGVTLQVVPASVELAGEEEGTVVVIARNETEQPVSDLRLSWFTNSGVAVSTAVEETVSALPANAEVAWTLSLTQPANPETATVHLRLDYAGQAAPADAESEGEGVAPAHVVTAGVQVTAPAVEEVQDVAGVELKSTAATIDEKRPGTVNLIVENKGDTPLTVTDVITVSPGFLGFAVPPDLEGLVLAPKVSRVFPVTVMARERVRPGKQLLLFELALAWTQDGHERTGTVVASQEVDVGVFGESQILTLLGVPAFFLLPGFLMVATFEFLWQRVTAKDEDDEFPLATSSSKFWLIAITLSLIAAVLIPLVTNQDYLASYGLQDIMTLWFVSIALGGLFYILFFAGQMIQTRRAAARTPAEGDKPGETLQKLANRKATLKRDRVRVKIDDGEYMGFLLQARDLDANQLWIAPKIYVTNVDDLSRAQQTRLDEIIDRGEDANEVIEFLSQLDLKWDDNWPKPGPYPVKTTDLQVLDEETIVGVL